MNTPQRKHSSETLSESFKEINECDSPLMQEWYLLNFAKENNLSSEEVRALYNSFLEQKKSSLNFWAYRSWLVFKEKTLWDWFQLLIIPLILATSVWYLNTQNTNRDNQIRAEKERQDALNKYYEFASSFISKEKAATAKSPTKAEESTWVALRARTLSVLRELDNSRKIQVLRFLMEADLIDGDGNEPKVKLIGADLRGLDLSESDIDFSGKNLEGVDLRNSNLSAIKFISTNLSKANFTGATLKGTDLTRADLFDAQVKPEQLITARFCDGFEVSGKPNKTKCFADAHRSDIGVIETNSGVGLSIRYGPGLDYSVAYGMQDGSVIETVGEVVERDGFSWGRLADNNWIQLDYVSDYYEEEYTLPKKNPSTKKTPQKDDDLELDLSP